MKRLSITSLALISLLFSGSVLAQQCQNFDDVRETCLDSIRDGVSDIFSSDDERERADSAGDATNSCTDCASDFIGSTIDDIGEDFDYDQNSSD